MPRVLVTAEAHVRGVVYAAGETYEVSADHANVIVDQYGAGERLPDLEPEIVEPVTTTDEGLGAEERDAVDQAALTTEPPSE